MPAPTQIKTYVADGPGLLTACFRDKPNVTGILASLSNEVQTLENAIFDFLYKLQLSNHPLPGGPWDILDKIGKIVGAPPRNGRSDADYLPFVQLQVRINNSNGLAEDIIQIAALIVTGATYRELAPASWDLTVIGAGTPQITALVTALHQARAAGVAGHIRYSTWTSPPGVIAWAYTPAGIAGAGFAYNPTGAFPNAFLASAET